MSAKEKKAMGPKVYVWFMNGLGQEPGWVVPTSNGFYMVGEPFDRPTGPNQPAERMVVVEHNGYVPRPIPIWRVSLTKPSGPAVEPVLQFRSSPKPD